MESEHDYDRGRGELARLADKPLGPLMFEFAAPAVVSMLVNSIYNIVDQIFIGWGVGYLGNAATTVCFPLVAITLALGLLLGNGSSANFSLALGRGRRDEAAHFVGNSLLVVTVIGVALAAAGLVFIDPLLRLFGATPAVMPYAHSYGSICLFGTPMVMVTLGLVNVVRADGSPRWAMWASLVGALLNTALDPIFIFDWGLGMGVAGAATATVISQAASCLFMAAYVRRFTAIDLCRRHFRLRWPVLRRVLALGASNLLNNVAFTIVQIIMNNALVYWGARSIYGTDIPLSVLGIVMKINQIMIAVLIGIGIGAQPILGYNYGACNMGRVRSAYRLAAGISTIVCCGAWAVFQFFPDQLMALFGHGSPLYFEFARRCFRVFLFAAPTVGYQIVSSIHFQATGRPARSIVLTLVQQLICLVPLILLLPLFWGFDGLLYTNPLGNLIGTIATTLVIVPEMHRLRAMEDLPETGSA